MEEFSKYSVFVRNVCKSYQKGSPTLQNLSMTVPQSCIYALLGASGCGKSSLLYCIAGVQNFDSGNLLVLGKLLGTRDIDNPTKRLGYMPQETALYNHMSIKDMVDYYGRLYNLSSVTLEKNLSEVNNILKLPDQNILIGKLSGGQKRRVSLALVLIHDPDLIILDEPTVGLDPLLRIEIWRYFKTLVKIKGTTIIITTHYTEEAKLADKIGFLRNGSLLVEDSPKRLLEKYRCDLLEDVVKHLCFKTDKDRNLSHNRTTERYEKFLEEHKLLTTPPILFERHDSVQVSRYSKLLESCNRVYGFFVVIWLFFVRHPIFFVSVLLFPVVQGSLTILIFGSQMHGLHFGVVNHDNSNCPTELDHTNSSTLTPLSCAYVAQLKNSTLFALDMYISENDALESVKLGQSWGYIVFPPNYSQNSLDVMFAQRYAANESITGSRIGINMDFSHTLAAQFILKELHGSFMVYLQHLAASFGIAPQNARLPLQFRAPVYGSPKDEQYQFVLPGIMFLAIASVTIGMAGILLLTDYEQGTLIRAKVAGQNSVELVASHMVFLTLMVFAEISIWTTVNHFFFHIEIEGSIVLYFSFWLGAGVWSATLGLFLAIVPGDIKKGFVATFYVISFGVYFGGVVFSKEFQSSGAHVFSTIFPISLPVEALRSIMIKGMGIEHALVWPGIAVLSVSILCFFAASILLLPKLWKKKFTK